MLITRQATSVISKIYLYFCVLPVLEEAIKRRHLGTLEKAIERGNKSRFQDKIADVLQEAEELRQHLSRLNNIAHDVLEMKQSTISEMRSYKNPQPIIVDIMMATFLMLGEKEVYVQVLV